MCNNRLSSQGSRQKRFFRQHIIALSVVSLITLLAIALIVWILLTQSTSQSTFLISIVVGIVTIVFGPTSWYIWIIESSKKSGEQQQNAHVQDQQITGDQVTASTLPEPSPASTTYRPLSNGSPMQTQTPVLTSADTANEPADRRWANVAGERNEPDAQPDEMPFQVGHPLPKEAITYIERQADQDALRHLQRMEYIALIDPRQQGKTSLIIHLMHKLSQHNFVLFDLSEPVYQNKSEEEWYQTLGDKLLRELRFLPPVTKLPLPKDSTSWEYFLNDIAEASRQAKQKMVIILDEVREIPSSYATPFFTVIRMVFNQRPLQPHYEYLTFITSGAFNPNELIRDEQVSKFIAQSIHLDDFDLIQVKQLVEHLRLSEELTEVVAQRVYEWTEGQPYLTQKVCQLFSSHVLPHSYHDLNVLVDKLGNQLYDDQPYLLRIKRLHEKEPELFQFAQRIAYGNRPPFSSGLFDAHFRLAHIYGVIKADEEHRCRIRNRICEHALTHITQPLQ